MSLSDQGVASRLPWTTEKIAWVSAVAATVAAIFTAATALPILKNRLDAFLAKWVRYDLMSFLLNTAGLTACCTACIVLLLVTLFV